jgi:hypothetical protein
VATQLLRRSLFPSVCVAVALTLLVGDLEGTPREVTLNLARLGEARLLRNVPAEKLRAMALKAGDQERETSSLPFLRTVSPQIVVIQSGGEASPGAFCLTPRSSLVCAHAVTSRLCGPTIGTSKTAATRVHMPTPITSLCARMALLSE